MDSLTVIERLAAALVVGAVIGINRDLRRKPAGLRTHALVSIGSAVIVMAAIAIGSTADGISRVIQGLLAGIGFLGAGVIIHHRREHRVQGLTTAASIWVAAGMGAACGLALYGLAAATLAAALLVLVFGGPIEDAVAHRLRGHGPTQDGGRDGDSRNADGSP